MEHIRRRIPQTAVAARAFFAAVGCERLETCGGGGRTRYGERGRAYGPGWLRYARLDC
jgi:hypothetical protein